MIISVNNPVPVIVAGSVAFTGGVFTLAGTGGAGQTYVLLTSANLVVPVWTPVMTNVADTNGVFNFTDPGATNPPAVLSPPFALTGFLPQMWYRQFFEGGG